MLNENTPYENYAAYEMKMAKKESNNKKLHTLKMENREKEKEEKRRSYLSVT